MDSQDMKDMWQAYDKKLDRQIQLNTKLLKRMDMDRTRTALSKFMRTPVLGTVIGLVMQMILGWFIYNHLDQPYFAGTAGLIYLFALGQTIFSIYQSSQMLQLDYDAPVVEIQKKLERIKILRVRYLTITRFAYALLWVPVLIVGAKLLFDADLFAHLDNTWLLIQMSIGLVCVGFGIWLSKRAAEQKVTSPLLHKILNNISINDITGRSLASAVTFLHDIEAFEQEA